MPNVLMRHPNNKTNVVEVSERAYDTVWEAKGWELVNPYRITDQPDTRPGEVPGEIAGAPDQPTEPEKDHLPVLDEMTDAQLREAAAELGIEDFEQLSTEQLRSLVGNTPEFYA